MDCGGLSELMTIYVIFSRVKSADGLLLLRAFCEQMFQMGALPGPYCLLKLLRHKFQTERMTEQQNAGAAQAESETRPADGSVNATPNAAPELTPANLTHTGQDGNQDCPYGAEAAIAEYKQRMAMYDAWRGQRKQFGPEWRCGYCGLSLPAAGF